MKSDFQPEMYFHVLITIPFRYIDYLTNAVHIFLFEKLQYLF